MRISKVVAALLIGAAVVMPNRASAQVNISVDLGRLLGPQVSIYAYSQPTYGDWHTEYRQWTPVTLYYYEGNYYRKSVKGSRAVAVYSRNGEYFMPPEDKEWVGKDKRYDYKAAPADEDRGRAKHKDKDENDGRGRGRGKP